jgi:hypothetical protein
MGRCYDRVCRLSLHRSTRTIRITKIEVADDIWHDRYLASWRARRKGDVFVNSGVETAEVRGRS